MFKDALQKCCKAPHSAKTARVPAVDLLIVTAPSFISDLSNHTHTQRYTKGGGVSEQVREKERGNSRLTMWSRGR